ncbi:MAG: SDR family oxidoreductase, partial [Paracoccaceae bacterium]
MKTLAMELGPQGIRVNAILPGSVNGPRIDRVFADEAAAKGMTADAVRRGYANGTALQSLVDASDIASMAVFLASDGARMVSGQTLTVDGFTINPDPQVGP